MKLLRSPFVVGTVDIEDSIKSEDTKSLGVDSAWYGKLVSVVASTLRRKVKKSNKKSC